MVARSRRLYLQDILDAIQKIESYTKGLSFRNFSRNAMVVDAVIRNFEVIGEAAKNLPVHIKNLHQEIPWKEMSAMRNKVVHEYFGVDVDILWTTITDSLPALKRLLREISL